MHVIEALRVPGLVWFTDLFLTLKKMLSDIMWGQYCRNSFIYIWDKRCEVFQGNLSPNQTKVRLGQDLPVPPGVMFFTWIPGIARFWDACEQKCLKEPLRSSHDQISLFVRITSFWQLVAEHCWREKWNHHHIAVHRWRCILLRDILRKMYDTYYVSTSITDS